MLVGPQALSSRLIQEQLIYPRWSCPMARVLLLHALAYCVVPQEGLKSSASMLVVNNPGPENQA